MKQLLVFLLVLPVEAAEIKTRQLTVKFQLYRLLINMSIKHFNVNNFDTFHAIQLLSVEV